MTDKKEWREMWILEFDDGHLQVSAIEPRETSYYNQHTREPVTLLNARKVILSSAYEAEKQRADALENDAQDWEKKFNDMDSQRAKLGEILQKTIEENQKLKKALEEIANGPRSIDKTVLLIQFDVVTDIAKKALLDEK